MRRLDARTRGHTHTHASVRVCVHYNYNYNSHAAQPCEMRQREVQCLTFNLS